MTTDDPRISTDQYIDIIQRQARLETKIDLVLELRVDVAENRREINLAQGTAAAAAAKCIEIEKDLAEHKEGVKWRDRLGVTTVVGMTTSLIFLFFR